MKIYDWVVVGGGLAGAALSYELATRGWSVLLLDQDPVSRNATRYSYGGIAFWSGTNALTRQLCQEGLELHRELSAELDSDTQFRELDLVLTIASGHNPDEIAAGYSMFAIPPTLVDAKTACELEPLLNRKAIAGALTIKHGHVNTDLIIDAYHQAFFRAGGTMRVGRVTEFVQRAGRVTGVGTSEETYTGANVAVCAGGLSRMLLQQVNITVPCYFTHAELVEIPPVDMVLKTLVMPADAKRFELEAQAGRADKAPLWDQENGEVAPYILDAGAVQFLDGRIRIGQISRALSSPDAQVDAASSETEIRAAVGNVLPFLQNLSGQWHRCLVAFSGDRLPLVGQIANIEGLYLFSGFSNPFAILPPLARRFAADTSKPGNDPILAELSPNRFH